jgi:raffinose/stachyose/melibiose transport system permease protein
MTAASVRKARTRRAVKYGILSLFALPWVVLPLWFLIVNSFKSEADASRPSIALPTDWHFIENYTAVLFDGGYLVGLKNTLIVVIPVVAAVLILGAMAAWTFARSNSMTLKVFYYVLALSVILPPAIVPTVVMITKAGLTGTLLGYMLALVGTRVGIIVFLTTGYIRTLPSDFEEAAEIDGASRWQMFWRVVLPLLAPVLFTAAVMTVINVWNDFFFALYMTKGAANATIPLTLYTFANNGLYGLRWNLVFAQVVLSALPLLVAYVLMQRRILSGLTDGGVTG